MRLIDLHTPKLNPVLANGLAQEHMKEVESYIGNCLRGAFKNPYGLEYIGMERCTPQEEIAEVTKKRNGRSFYDAARSDIYMVKLIFAYKGKRLQFPRYLSLPFVGDAGGITIGGSKFIISPVLADKVVSITMSNVFIRLLRAKMTVERDIYTFSMNDVRTRTYLALSQIYIKSAKNKRLKPTMKAHCLLAHYLFTKYGFSETFRRFAHCEAKIHTAREDLSQYDPDEWTICDSLGLQPKGLRGVTMYERTQLRIVIRTADVNPYTTSLIGSFFYIADHFPTKLVDAASAESVTNWLVMLGTINLTGNMHHGTLIKDMTDHMQSLDEYMDPIVQQKLADIGIVVNNVYDLMAVIMRNMHEWLLRASDKVASMYERELSVLYPVMYNITSAIFKMYFAITKAEQKKELSEKEIVSFMNQFLKPGLIFRLHSGKFANPINSSGDNKAFKITAMLVSQSGGGKSGSRGDKGPAKSLHASIAECGGFLQLPKKEPSGRSRANLTAEVSPTGAFMRKEKFRALLDDCQEKFKR